MRRACREHEPWVSVGRASIWIRRDYDNFPFSFLGKGKRKMSSAVRLLRCRGFQTGGCS